MFSTSQANSSIPAFIAKLWHMVSNPKSDHLICWSEDGTSFIIKNYARFSSELLPMYYKHNKMASFIRQLNKYGFHKVMFIESSSNNDRGGYEFAHPDFIKGSPELLVKIKRKLTNSTKEPEYKHDSKIVPQLLQNVQLLQAKQNVFESKLKAMKSENDALWKELSILRQKHHKQQKIVNKLVQFLVILMQQSRGVNVNNFVPLMLKDGRPCLMAIKDSNRSKSPLICEVDTNDMQGVNTLKKGVPINITTAASPNPIAGSSPNPITITSVSSSNPDVGKEVVNSLISSVNDSEHVNIPSTYTSDEILLNDGKQVTVNMPSTSREIILDNGEKITITIPSTSSGHEVILDRPSSTSSASDPDFVLPIPEVILSENEPLNIEIPSSSNIVVPENQLIVFNNNKAAQSSNKKSLKRKQSSKRFNKKDCLLTLPELDENKSNEAKGPLDISLESALVPEATTGNYNLNSDDGNMFVLSPSSETNSSVLSSSTEPNIKEFISSSDTAVTNKDNFLVSSDNNSLINKEDINNHLDMIQNDLEALKDILHTENLSLDTSTLMGLFNADDPLSLNLPEFNKNSTDDYANNGNQIIPYSPGNFIDFSDLIDDETEDFGNVTLASPKELCTPLVEFEDDSSQPPESKRLKK